MTTKRPTIDDVARLSGVARATVSRVLNGGPNVSEKVRTAVLAAVKTLNYRVNPQARSLAGGGSGLLALILASDLEAEPNSFYTSALELGALRECLAAGYQLLTRPVPQQSADRHRQVLDLIETQRCQGVILTPPFADDHELIGRIRALDCHVVAISPGPDTQALVDGVGVDDEAGGHDIAAHLISLGHRRFGFIAGIAGHLSAERRLLGVRRAMTEHDLDPDAVAVERGDFTFRSGGLIAATLLDGALPPTALICANDDMAAGALSVAHARRLDVPGDLSITGFDDTPVSEIVWPPLATVHQPLKVMGADAVRILARRLSGGAGQGGDWRFHVAEHRVVPRASADRPRVHLATATA
ncbi:MAG: LacI family DNA-binding transcriptional regulator [Brevundimonas sp.]|nr:MAG: LacI family DNA-binding transcriptional regulator [Brevundimonas sp.]